MRWLACGVVLFIGTFLGIAGCGSGPSDESGGSSRLTMQFLEFNGDGITQEDDVFQNSAQVDVCQTLCQAADIFVDVVFEQFTQTSINAVFINNGKADILLDSYTVDIEGSGIDPFTRRIGAMLIGGRCSDGSGRSCGSDTECRQLGSLTAVCLHEPTTVGGLLLFDFGTKDTIIPGQCPVCNFQTGDCSAGTKVPETFDVVVTFSGTDTTNERFTISAGYVANFADANNCMATTQPG